jgi:hypothetical protein
VYEESTGVLPPVCGHVIYRKAQMAVVKVRIIDDRFAVLCFM